AVKRVIHHHAARLHVGIADGWPDKTEAGLLQRTTHGLGLLGNRRNLLATVEVIDQRLPANEGPQPLDRLFQLKPRLCIATRGLEFASVADDSGIEHALVYLLVGHAGQALRVEAEQYLSIALTLFQHGDPGQPRLERFEHKEFEQALRIS